MTSHIGKRSTRLVASLPAYISAAPRAVRLPYLPQRGNDGWIIASLQIDDPSCALLLAFCILDSVAWNEKLADHMHVTDCA